MRKVGIRVVFSLVLALTLIFSLTSVVGARNYGGGYKYSGATQHYYKVIHADAPLSWEEAQAAAESVQFTKRGVTYYGHLACITAQPEQDDVAKMMGHKKGSAYIGGYTPGGVTQWDWVTDELWNYTNWESDPGLPVASSYVAMSQNGYWQAGQMSTELEYYIVECAPLDAYSWS